MSTFYARIEVVDPPKTERMAERVCDGLERNIDHERFYARICEEIL